MHKKSLLLIVFLTIFISANSQTQLYCPSPDGRYDGFPINHITLGVGPTFLYGDIEDYESNIGFGGQLKYDRKILKGLLVGAEVQLGNLKASENGRIDSLRIESRRVTNFYKSASLNLSVYPFHYLNSSVWAPYETTLERILNGIYLGVGIGGVLNSNSYSDLNVDNSLNPDDVESEDTDSEGGDSYKKRSNSLILPVANAGFVFRLTPSPRPYKAVWSIVGNAQASFSGNDMLDGLDPDLKANKNKDMYMFYTLGVRYSFSKRN